MQLDDHDALRNLDDKLNLTGQVARIGADAVKAGGFSDVWEGTYLGRTVAVKVIREVGSSLPTLTRRLVRETRAWARLHHRNVLPLLGFAHGFGAGQLASLVSPWMPGGTAAAHLKTQPPAERLRVITEVADGLSYLHRHDVVHGDLKGDNILIGPRGEARLADFGLSSLLTEVNNATTSALGSVRWMARELFAAETDAPHVTCASDVWAYGMTVLELFTSCLPYAHLKNDWAVIVSVHQGALPPYPPPPAAPPEDLWALCGECWHTHPELRPSMRAVAKRVWELELGYKLAQRPAAGRDAPRPEEPDAGSRKRRSDTELTDSSDSAPESEPRPRKSPKLAQLELDGAAGRAYALVPAPSPSPRSTPRSRTASTATLPGSSGGGGGGGDAEFSPRRLAASYSEWDAYPRWHAQRMQGARTHSAPASPAADGFGLGLELSASPRGRGAELPEVPHDTAGAMVRHGYGHAHAHAPAPSPLRQLTHPLGAPQHYHEPDDFSPSTHAGYYPDFGDARYGAPQDFDRYGAPQDFDRYGVPQDFDRAVSDYYPLGPPEDADMHLYRDPYTGSRLSPVLTPPRGSPSAWTVRPDDPSFADTLLFDDPPAPRARAGRAHRAPVDFTTPHGSSNASLVSPALSDGTPAETPLGAFAYADADASPALGALDDFDFPALEFGGAALALVGGVGVDERECEYDCDPDGSPRTVTGSPRLSPRRHAPQSPSFSPLHPSASPIRTNA